MADDPTAVGAPPRGGVLTLLAPLLAAAVFLMSVAYWCGWTETAGGPYLYWTSQLLAFGSVLGVLLFRRDLSARDALAAVLLLAVTHYLFKWMYSPDQLRFADELQHWRGGTDAVANGKMFVQNRGLPIATDYPGLAAITASIAATAGVSITTAAFTLMALVRVVTAGLLFMIARRITGSHRAAAIAALLTATGPHYLFFGAMFVYQNIALLFFFLGLLALAVWQHAGRRRGWFAGLAFTAVAAAVVSHHIVAIIMSFTLAGLAVIDWCRARKWNTAVLALWSTALTAVWMRFVAANTIAYLNLANSLRGYATSLADLLNGTLASTKEGASPLVTGSVLERGVAVAGYLLIAAVLPCPTTQSSRCGSPRPAARSTSGVCRPSCGPSSPWSSATPQTRGAPAGSSLSTPAAWRGVPQ